MGKRRSDPKIQDRQKSLLQEGRDKPGHDPGIKITLMNPYKQIAREHLSKEDLEELLAEMDKPAPTPMTAEEQSINHYKEQFIASHRKRK